MIKRILKIWFTIAVYELGKHLTSLLIAILESEDDIEAPKDFALETDQYDLNRIKAEVSD
ncbi:transcriptional activator RinB [Staphylococcus sp. HMSC071G07]|uniref:transcriptional activator RinB n=1 Tax=Staphylococcus sp. HMSC071G07 TaxID=1739306 RepID=UPI0008A29860|nr:transcriptional regulator [Staphylococcus sp. HMSC071G07]OFK74602.1 transcriptional regulator [Staphylococcus sp. HMSC071G07]